MFREIKPELILKQRAKVARSLTEVATVGGPPLTRMMVHNYEKGKNEVSRDNLAPLLRGLGCTYEDISVEVKL